MSPDKAVDFLHEMAKSYQKKNQHVKEDSEYWANLFNSDNCYKIASLITTLNGSFKDTTSMNILCSDHLLECYEVAYWCYLSDKDSTEEHKHQDLMDHLANIVSIERVITYLNSYNTGYEKCRKIRDSVYAKYRIAHEMNSGKQYVKPAI